MIKPDWQAPARVRAIVTTRELGDLKREGVRRELRALLPAEPAWLKQVHGRQVIDLDRNAPGEGDAAVTRTTDRVCVVQMADCMPVLFADQAGTTVAAAHAGWRGLAGGVLEATIDAMRVPRRELVAWLGPAIGPRVYEVGEEVRDAFRGYEAAFTPTRPGHWLLDLYAVARSKLSGLKAVAGGGFCTYSEPGRFFSFRRDRTSERMGALIWLA
ncbi:MAG TPA: peptidoglycan editing factor PgeF [Burkholderiales bacterium]|nr:peptidoglycan editing factor PgeF [Burkholderiales bacterium]